MSRYYNLAAYERYVWRMVALVEAALLGIVLAAGWPRARPPAPAPAPLAAGPVRMQGVLVVVDQAGARELARGGRLLPENKGGD